MNNKKILVSFLLVVLIALSASAVSAADVADDVVAADDADIDVISANNVVPDGQTADAVQKAVNNASVGDTVKLNGEYNFTNNTVTISGKDNLVIDGQGTTTITGYGDGQGFFYVTKSAAVTITGITFIDNNPKNKLTYDGSINGWGVQFNGKDANGGVVDNCKFQDFNQAVVVKSCNNVTVKNSEFLGGIATKLVNDPTVNKEQGSKVISVGGSFYTTIQNNTFDGIVLDAISIAQASGDAKIIGNTFKNNVYSIFFGGASTDGTYIVNNTFENCGSYNGPFNGTTVLWEEYPVISIQKASSGVYITGNTFKAINKNFLIAAEQGNTAHGYPSTLGDINVTDNTIVKYNDSVDTNGVTLLHILCRSGSLNPYAPITVTGNTFVAGVKPLVVWENDWGSETGSPSDIVIPAAGLVPTQLSITDVGQDGSVVLVLTDINGKPLAGEVIKCAYNGLSNVTNATTDEYGSVMFKGNANDLMRFGFEPEKTYMEAYTTLTLPNTTVTKIIEIPVPVLVNLTQTEVVVETIKVYAVENGNTTQKITLVTKEGVFLANRVVFVEFISNEGGITLPIEVITDANGTAYLPLDISEASEQFVLAYFPGDKNYTASFGIAESKVMKNAAALTTPTKTFKVKATKKVTVTLKSGSKKLKGKKVTLKVNGKTYTATTKSNGQATFTVKITKAGTYTYTAKFAGDGAYKSVSKTAKIKVKK